ncbi:MAG TPA: DUF4838 domain-containing protein, partial [Opitutales bacterium]|nr:DUF4838 domain-containing protein [Opitutales bacterium]
MPIRLPITIILLSSVLIAGSTQARSAWWKPERTLGSAELALVDIRAIHLPPKPSARLQAATGDLIAYWPGGLKREDSEASKQSLVLLRNPASHSYAGTSPASGMPEAGGFSFHRDRTRVYLTAATDEGLANGLYALSRELLGLRWYWPGELGFETVGEVAEKFPDGVWRERPAFVQRTLYPVNSDYGRRNGLNRVYAFNHNLARIFTTEVFEESPEVFAEIGGERRRPKGSAGTDPQPDFTEPKTVQLAAEAAREHFEANPQANSFSLSINDNSLFDEGLATAKAVAKWKVESGKWKVPYFRGRPNYTDLVFGFMNQVAEQVFERRDCRLSIADDRSMRRGLVSNLKNLASDLCPLSSDKKHASYLTALAYYWTEQSPSFEIHPRVMPVLTSDRAQWHDPDYRAEDKALIRRWADSGAERIATWDYYFGAPYPYPRQFTQWIGESIAYLHREGIDVFFSQLPSIWGLDGPKAWLTAELLRDPEQEVTALLDEYYDEFFGPAAEPIREFYEIAERTRNERAGKANWIKFYKDEAGIELFDEDRLRRMRACLDKATQAVRVEPPKEAASALRAPQGLESVETANAAPTDGNRFARRVQVVSQAFSYTEAYAAYHRS